MLWVVAQVSIKVCNKHQAQNSARIQQTSGHIAHKLARGQFLRAQKEAEAASIALGYASYSLQPRYAHTHNAIRFPSSGANYSCDSSQTIAAAAAGR